MADTRSKDYQATIGGFFEVLLALNVVFFFTILFMEFRAHLIAAHDTSKSQDLEVTFEEAAYEGLQRALTEHVSAQYARGEKAFVKCQLCHTLGSSLPNFGPDLTCIHEHRIAESAGPDYRYSEALSRKRSTDEHWYLQSLIAFVEDPDAYVQDVSAEVGQTRMPFPGTKGSKDSPDELRSIIEYLYWSCARIDSLRVLRVRGDECSEVSEEALIERVASSGDLRPHLAENTELYVLPASKRACRPE